MFSTLRRGRGLDQAKSHPQRIRGGIPPRKPVYEASTSAAAPGKYVDSAGSWARPSGVERACTGAGGGMCTAYVQRHASAERIRSFIAAHACAHYIASCACAIEGEST